MSETVQNVNTMFNRFLSPSVRVAGIVLGLILAYKACLLLAPGAIEVADDKLREMTGKDILQLEWTDEKKAKQPVAFLRYSQAKFAVWDEEVGKRSAAQQRQLTKIRQTRENLDFNLERVNNYLHDGREIYQRYTANNETSSVKFAGRLFSGAEIFKKQLALLFHEKKAVESQIRQTEDVEQQLVEKYHKGALEAADVRLKLQLIEPRIVLAESSRRSYNFEKLTEEVEVLLKETNRVIAEPIPLVSVSADLEQTDPNARQSKGESDSASTDFESFLSGSGN